MIRTRYLVLLALAAYLLTGVAQVRPEERAVVRRFGRVVARPGPGLWVGFPAGIDRLHRVPTGTLPPAPRRSPPPRPRRLPPRGVRGEPDRPVPHRGPEPRQRPGGHRLRGRRGRDRPRRL